MNEMLESVLHEVEMLPEAHQQRIVRVIKEELSRAKREVAVTPGRSGLFGSGHEWSVRARFAAARPLARLGR
jgi:hypothetical protein